MIYLLGILALIGLLAAVNYAATWLGADVAGLQGGEGEGTAHGEGGTGSAGH